MIEPAKRTKRAVSGGATAGGGRASKLGRLPDLKVGELLTAKICRYDPTTDHAPRYEIYEVPYVQWMRVLDVLNYLAEEKNVELAYPWFCGTEKCGHCVVRVNSREVLACWESAEREMVIEPIRHLPVVRDLVVDRQPYEEAILKMTPWLVRKEPYPGFPEKLADRDMRQASFALDCINCMACQSICPVLELGTATKFIGPGPIVQLAQVALDPRDGLDRGKIALEDAAIFECISCYKCDDVCPVDIPIVGELIEPLKAKAHASRPTATKGYDGAVLNMVEQYGRSMVVQKVAPATQK